MKQVTVSAPGKVLLVGGYLVLEAPNVGFVVAADKRFYTTVGPSGRMEKSGDGNGSPNDVEDDHPHVHTTTIIRVESPQFHTNWEYKYDHSCGTLTPSPSNVSANPFVERTLRICLLYLTDRQRRRRQSRCRLSVDDDEVAPIPTPMLPPVLDVVIRADNDFYSVLPHLPPMDPHNGGGGVDRTPAAVAALPRFLPCPVDPETGKAIINKTGLGSSAALTASLVGAIVHSFLTDTDDNDEYDDDDASTTNVTGVIHNLAQICHCHAQGKVGSGFDVSAACHGTHLYRRFPEQLLSGLLEELDRTERNPAVAAATAPAAPSPTTTLNEMLARLVELVPWRADMVEVLSLPPQVQIVLADVRGGSESPGMARAVMKWKAAAAAAALADSDDSDIPHWTALANLNSTVVDWIRRLSPSNGDGDDDNNKVDYDHLATIPATHWPDGSPLKGLYTALRGVRTHLREMGEAAGVPIEPPPQTALCDATAALPGVIAALVPGAGGYDAIACLYIDRPAVLDAIGTLWASWKDPIICPLSVKASEEGLRVEEVVGRDGREM